jgi:flagellar biosynthesis chaperone FliJ
MGLIEEKEKAWKEAEERAKAMKEKEKAVFQAAKALKGKKEPDEIYQAAQGMHKAYEDYGEEAKKPGIVKRILEWLGF